MPQYYKHVKRGSVYTIVAEGEYRDETPALEENELIYYDKVLSSKYPAVYLATTLIEKPDQYLHYKGLLQCSKPVYKTTMLVVYQNIDDHKIWIRPSSEFFDGRFIWV